MGAFCFIILICGIVYVICKGVIESYRDEKEETEFLKRRLKADMDSLKYQAKDLDGIELRIKKGIHNFFNNPESVKCDYRCLYKIIQDDINKMESKVKEMEETVFHMKGINRELSELVVQEDKYNLIDEMENRIIYTKAPEIISKVKGYITDLKKFEKEIYKLPVSNMVDGNNYGMANKEYWDLICGKKREEVVEYIIKCKKALDNNRIDMICKININKIVESMWFFAREKHFVSSDYQMALEVFNKIYRQEHVDCVFMDLYIKYKIGGEEVIRESIHKLLKSECMAEKLEIIASGLMWMNAYRSEYMVLQYMISKGIEMSIKAQERLFCLSSGAGEVAKGFAVESSDQRLYFDVSTLAWKDTEYVGFFENLVFQDKELSYSLAIRDESKELFIAKGMEVPQNKIILEKFKTVLEDEYGNGISVESIKGFLLSGSGEEELNGFLICIEECKQLGIFVHIAKIGKKFMIKFYTLFMPTATEVLVQKQQALSMHNKLSPTVTMWESSLKDTTLMAVEQILNTEMKGNKTEITEEGYNTKEIIF